MANIAITMITTNKPNLKAASILRKRITATMIAIPIIAFAIELVSMQVAKKELIATIKATTAIRFVMTILNIIIVIAQFAMQVIVDLAVTKKEEITIVSWITTRKVRCTTDAVVVIAKADNQIVCAVVIQGIAIFVVNIIIRIIFITVNSVAIVVHTITAIAFHNQLSSCYCCFLHLSLLALAVIDISMDCCFFLKILQKRNYMIIILARTLPTRQITT